MRGSLEKGACGSVCFEKIVSVLGVFVLGLSCVSW